MQKRSSSHPIRKSENKTKTKNEESKTSEEKAQEKEKKEQNTICLPKYPTLCLEQKPANAMLIKKQIHNVVSYVRDRCVVYIWKIGVSLV